MLHIRQNKYTGVMEIAEEGRMVGSKEIDRLIDEGKAVMADTPVQSSRIKFHIWDRRPNEVYVDPLIFKMMLPKSYTINDYGMLISPVLAKLGGAFLRGWHFNNRSFYFTFQGQSSASSLRKAHALRRRMVKLIGLVDMPHLSISTLTLGKYQDFVRNIVSNQHHPEYRSIMNSGIRYTDEDGFNKINQDRIKQRNKIKRLIKNGKLSPSWLDGLGS